MAFPVIRFKRGNYENLPALQAGEPAFTLDTYDLYVGLNSTTEGNKFFGSHRYWSREDSTYGSGINLVESSSNGSSYITLRAPASLAGVTTFTLPEADGSSGQILITDGSGNLSFSNSLSFSSLVISGITTFQGDIKLGNTNKAIFGGGDDLQIYNDGLNSYIVDAGVGNLYLRGTAAIELQNANGTENYARFNVDGASELYYDNSKKLETTGYGATVFGTLKSSQIDVSGIGTISDLRSSQINVSSAGTISRLFSENISASGVSTFSNGLKANNIEIGVSGSNIITTSSGSLSLQAADSSIGIQGGLTVTGNSLFANNANFFNPSATVSIGGKLSVTGSQADFNSIYSAGIGTFANLNAYSGVVTSLSGTNLNYSGIGTIASLDSTEASIDYLNAGITTATNLTVNGDARITGILTVGSSSITFDGDNNIIGVGTNIVIDGNTGIISAISMSITGESSQFTDVYSDSVYANVGVITSLTGTDISYSGIGTIETLDTTTGTIDYLSNTNLTSGIATITTLDSTNGTVDYLDNTNLTSGIATITTLDVSTGTVDYLENINLSSGIATITTLDADTATVDYLSGTNVSYSGIGTIETLDTTTGTIDYLDNTNLTSGIATITTVDISNGTIDYLDNTNLTSGIATITTLDVTTGAIDYLDNTNLTSGIATITTLDVTTGTIDYLSGTDISYSGIGTIETLDTTTGTIDYLDNTNLTSGIATITTLDTDTATVDYLSGTNVSYSGIGTIETLDTTTGTIDYLDNTNLTSGIATITTLDVDTGSIDYLTGTNVSYSGIGTIETLDTTTGTIDYLSGTNVSYSGIGTIETLDTTTGTIDYLDNTNLTSGIATITTVDVTNGTVDYLDNTNLTSGIATITTLDVTNGTVDYLDNTNLTSGIATITTLDVTTGTIDYLDNTNLTSGIATITNLDVTNGTVDYLNSTDVSVSGIVTASEFHTGPEGASIRVTSNSITGPSTIIIDPSAVGDDTGAVRIKGDLFVDGTQTVINSSTIELGDFNVGIATTVATDLILDGAGIGIGATSIRKTLTYDYSSDSLKSSENFDLSSGKVYKINEVEVLSSNQLTVENINSSGVGTISTLDVTNGTIDYLDNTNLTSGIATITTLDVTNSTVDYLDNTNLTSGIATITTLDVDTATIDYLSGVNVSYSGVGTIATLDTTTGTIDYLSNTNLTSGIATITTLDVDTATVDYLSGTNVSYSGIGTIETLDTTTGTIDYLSNTNLTSGIGTINYLSNTNLTSGIATVTTLDVDTATVDYLSGTNVSYSGIGTIETLDTTTGTIDYLDTTNLTSGVGTVNYLSNTNLTSGIATITTLDTTNGTVDYLSNTNLTSGIATITTLDVTTGTVDYLDNTNLTSGIATITTLDVDTATIDYLSGTNVSYSGIGTIETLDTTTGTIDYLDNTNLTSGIATITTLDVGTATVDYLSGTNVSYSGIGTIETLDTTTGTIDYLSGVNVSYSGIGTIETLDTTTGTIDYLDNTNLTSGIATITTLDTSEGTIDYLDNTNLTSGIATITTLDTDTATVDYLTGTNLSYSGIGTIGTLATVNATIDYLENININSSGIGTIATFNALNATIDYLNSTNINASGIITASSFYGNGNTLTGIAASEGRVYYVNVDGSDSNSGNTLQKPFATLAQALSVATSGDTIKVGAGTFSEAFPLTVPQGVHIVGMGIRSTFIQPTGATKQNDCFLLNGDTTVEDLTIGNFFEPGVGFKFASGAKTIIRSPYIQRVTVLNKGSVTSATDPYGFDTVHNPPATYKAGRGALIDGSVVDAGTLEPAMLFNESTFICPNNIALEMTNGARSEWVNCFTYFADKGIYAHDGAVGLGSVGYARIKTSGITTGTTPQANDELYYLESNSVSGTYEQVGTAVTITRVGHGLTVGDRIFADFTSGTATDGFYRVTGYVGVNTFEVTSVGSATTNGNISYKEALGFGTVTDYNTSSGISSITGKGEGLFQLPTERSGKTLTAFGNASLSTAQKKFGTASLVLDGTGDYAKVASNSDFGFGTGDFTVEGFVRLTAVDADQKLFDFRNAAASDTALHIGIAATNVVKVSYGSTEIISGITSLTADNWYHIAVSRSSGSTLLFIDGTQEGSTYSDSNDYGNSKPLVVGAAYDGTDELAAYVDEVRVSISARYTSSYTVTTSQFNSDGNDRLLLHFDGITGSTSFTDSSIPIQDIRWVRSGVGIATATRITLADYQQFGAEMRSIGSAAVFGNVGVSAEGPGCTLRLFAFNFGHIGSGKDFTQDISLVNQENEVVTTDNGKVYYVSIDQSGDFRVGSAFYVNQEEGTVNFGGQDFTLNSLSDLNITDGTNTSTLTPTTLTVGNIQLSGNEVTTTSGDLIINPSGISSTRIEGSLAVVGDINTTTDVKINGTSVLQSASDEAIALAIALG